MLEAPGTGGRPGEGTCVMGTNGFDPDRLAERAAAESVEGEGMALALVWLADAYRRSAPADGDRRVTPTRTRSSADGPDALLR